MNHPCVGLLRGRAEPRRNILDRIREVNPSYRVCWVPPGCEVNNQAIVRPGLWRIYEYMEHPMRQMAGGARLARFSQMSHEKRSLNPGLVYDAQASKEGLNYIADYVEEAFGTDAMFVELRTSEQNLAAHRSTVRKAQWQQGDAETLEEMNVNPQFRDYVRDVAETYYRRAYGNPLVPVAANLT